MKWKRKIFIFGFSCFSLGSIGFIVERQWSRLNRVSWDDIDPPNFKINSREDNIKYLKDKNNIYDILIIGGGATGSGIALDATTRKLNVALIEKDDFASGTSSRSTKLVHGGVRYLEKAFLQLDKEQYDLVREALHERKNFLKIAPHLSYELPIMIPLYKWWHIPYYWIGAKTYDFLAGKNALQASYFISKPSALEHFPHLARKSLKGAIVYNDGAHNDARMNTCLALTACIEGAHIANHITVINLLKNNNGKVCGVTVEDSLTGDKWDIHAKVIINATGPFSDSIRKMDDSNSPDIVCPSSGVHIILPDYYSPKHMGLLDANTSDGRVIFFLPWQNSVIAGTTDTPTKITDSPRPTEEEILFILKEISSYLSPDIQVRRSDVLSAWSGIRPLVRDPSKSSTEKLARHHIVNTSDSNLVTIAGGKWTTYRAMAEDSVNTAIKIGNLQPKEDCKTENTLLLGAHGYSPSLKIRLIQEYGMESQIAEHLAKSYGDRAYLVADLCKETKLHWPVVGIRLCAGYPYLEAEIKYAVRYEMARTLVDVIARRTRLAFLNVVACYDALPRIACIMQKELNWTDEIKENQIENAKEFLKTMGLSDYYNNSNPNEIIQNYKNIFQVIDKENTGTINLEQYKTALDIQGIKYNHNKLEIWFNTCQIEGNKLSFTDFIQLTEAIKNNEAEQLYEIKKEDVQTLIPLERSGGGI